MGLPLGSVVMERGYGPRGTISNSWGPWLVLGATPGVVMTGGKQGGWGKAVAPFTFTLSRIQRGPPQLCLLFFES